jgi:inosine/xanthosine triphosphate pyrophosphatase family protein
VEFSEAGEGFIVSIAERRNYIIRRASNLSKESHIIAANIDVQTLCSREIFTKEISAIAGQLDLSANTSVNVMIKSVKDDAAEAKEAADGVKSQIDTWFQFRDDGLETRKAGSTYSTLVDDTGFHVQQLGGKIGSFHKRQLETEAIRIGRVGSAGKRIVMREAADGGIAVVLEGSV